MTLCDARAALLEIWRCWMSGGNPRAWHPWALLPWQRRVGIDGRWLTGLTVMRRLRSGNWEYREMTAAEAEAEACDQAW